MSDASERFDPDVLAAYRQGGASGLDLIDEMLAIFRDDMPRRIESLRAAIERGDARDARRWAHSIKGGAVMVGARRLATIAEAFEQRASVEHAVDVPGAFTDAFVEACDLAARWRCAQGVTQR